MSLLRKALPVPVVAALIFAVAGACTEQDDGGPLVGGSGGTTAGSGVGYDDDYTREEEALLEAVRYGDYGEQFRGESDDTVLEAGHNMCAELDSGTSFEQLVDQLVDEVDTMETADQEAVGYLLGASIATLCPEYLHELGM